MPTICLTWNERRSCCSVLTVHGTMQQWNGYLRHISVSNSVMGRSTDQLINYNYYVYNVSMYIDYNGGDIMRNERLRGYLDGILLSILATGDSYGYEIVQEVNERTGGALSLKEGSLYPALKRLEAERWIEGYWGTDKDSGPRRRYYSLTESGKGQLGKIRSEWTAEQRLLSVFLGKVGLE